MTTKEIYEARFKKAVLNFKGIPNLPVKEFGDTALNTVTRLATIAGASEILQGLGEDIKSLISEGGGDGVRDKIDEVFDLASGATRRIISVAEIKSGVAHWASKSFGHVPRRNHDEEEC